MRASDHWSVSRQPAGRRMHLPAGRPAWPTAPVPARVSPHTPGVSTPSHPMLGVPPSWHGAPSRWTARASHPDPLFVQSSPSQRGIPSDLERVESITLVYHLSNPFTTGHSLFTWNDNGDPDNGPQATRSFWVTLRSLDGTQVAESGWISDTSWTAPDLADGTYQWRVKASDGAAESAWTGAWNLTVETGGDPPEPYFTSDYTLGGPGSTFVFTAVHFPPGAQASIALREPGQSDFRTLTQIPVPDSGTLVFVLSIPTSAAPGEYIVQIAVEGQNLLASAETQASLRLEQSLTIAAEEPPHTDPPPDGVPIIVLPESGTPNIYLPLVVR